MLPVSNGGNHSASYAESLLLFWGGEQPNRDFCDVVEPECRRIQGYYGYIHLLVRMLQPNWSIAVHKYQWHIASSRLTLFAVVLLLV